MVKKTVKKKIELKAEKRKVFGRKIKKLRQEGILPANIYGKKVKSQALQLDLKAFMPVYQEAGETSLINLRLKGETKARPVLIHNVQLNPVSDEPLHADFYQVSLKEKVTTEIPVELVGEAPAIKEKDGILIQPLNEVEVEALPAELPEKFEVNIGGLKEINDTFTVAELKAPQGVKILTGAKEILAKIEPPAKEEEIAPQEEEVSVEGETAKEGEAPEGEKEPAAGEKPGEVKEAEKGKEPEKSQKAKE